MNKFLLLALLCLVPISARADFSLNSFTGKSTVQTNSSGVPKTANLSRTNIRPSLEIVNERYVPDDIKKKYKMGDDYFEMTGEKSKPPIVIQPAGKPKKTLEIISGPPPVGMASLPAAQVPAPMPEPVPLASKPTLMVKGSPKAAPIPVPAARYDAWRARKGEVLKEVLKRWAEREGTDFVWTAAESPKVSKEYSYVGSFEKAVAGLMKQDSGQLKMKFSDDVVPVADTVPPPPVATPDGKNWVAANGASLQSVFQEWASAEGASLVWQPTENFFIPQSFKEGGSFESAVGGLLGKYESQKIRPVGQLYRNPATGEKVLVIKTDTAG